MEEDLGERGSWGERLRRGERGAVVDGDVIDETRIP